MLRAIILAAVIGGVVAGIFGSAVQAVRVIPLIHEAERYEHQASKDGHEDGAAQAAAPTATEDDQAQWAPADGLERTFFTVFSNVMTGIGYALLLAAVLGATGGGNWRKGMLVGLGGFAAFVMAPAVGLPPELPGMEAASLQARQLWWIATAIATAGGLALIFATSRAAWAALGVVVIVLPHIIGAPHPEAAQHAVPDALIHDFVAASIATGFLFWVVLGATTGYFFGRFERRA